MKKFAVAVILALAVVWGTQLLDSGQKQPAPGLPDLTVSLGKPAVSGTLEVGGTITIKPTVTNNGLTVVQTFSIVVYFSNHSLMTSQDMSQLDTPSSRKVDSIEITTPLAPGASTLVSAKVFHIPESFSFGDYYVTAIVDPGKKIAESNEANNRAELPVYVKVFCSFTDQICYSFEVYGKGFGQKKDTVHARVGPHTIPAVSLEWESYPGDLDKVKIPISPGLLTFGQTYSVGLYEGNKPIVPGEQEEWRIMTCWIQPQTGPSGTNVQVTGCFRPSPGTQKLTLWRNQQFVADVQVTSWSAGTIGCVIPAIPPGEYEFEIMDGGKIVSSHVHSNAFNVI